MLALNNYIFVSATKYNYLFDKQPSWCQLTITYMMTLVLWVL